MQEHLIIDGNNAETPARQPASLAALTQAVEEEGTAEAEAAMAPVEAAMVLVEAEKEQAVAGRGTEEEGTA